jgi:hypothetical protein
MDPSILGAAEQPAAALQAAPLQAGDHAAWMSNKVELGVMDHSVGTHVCLGLKHQQSLPV